MPISTLRPQTMGFICTTAHPLGCKANVDAQIQRVQAAGLPPLGRALVIGGSTGYGLASLIASAFGTKAETLAVCLEREPTEKRQGTAGWYNLAAVLSAAKKQGLKVQALNADAFANSTRKAVIQILKQNFGPIDSLVYSLASPRRTDPTDPNRVWKSALKPLDHSWSATSINLDTESLNQITVEPATEDEIHGTVKVMGGEDWELWVRALGDAGLLAPGFRTVSYSYLGPEINQPIYRGGTIGAAKEHLETTARRLNEQLSVLKGGAWVSINRALVTQAAAAIPVFPLYLSVLLKVEEELGGNEDTCAQILRLMQDHLAPGRTPTTDAEHRIRLDDLEMRPLIQEEVARRFAAITQENFNTLADFPRYKAEFLRLFGFGVPGIDYSVPVETLMGW